MILEKFIETIFTTPNLNKWNADKLSKSTTLRINREENSLSFFPIDENKGYSNEGM